MARYIVQCTYEIEVELSDDVNARFIIEENGCPGTGVVGAALEELMEECDEEGICWACKLGGENRILRRAEVVVVTPEKPPNIAS